MNIIKSKLYKALFLLFTILAIGVSGYMILSGDSFVNALYMTVITITTVGFGEVHPLSPEEKIFTILLIFEFKIFINYKSKTELLFV